MQTKWHSFSSSDNSAVWNDAVLDDDDNAVLDDKAQVLHVGFLGSMLVDDLDIAANPSVFVNDGLSYYRVSACSNSLRSDVTQAHRCFMSPKKSYGL